jgi:protein SCO1/2
LAVAATVLGQASQITVMPGSSSRSIDRSAVRIEQKLGDSVPADAMFRNRVGRVVRFGDLLGNRPAILLPIFYRCTGVCNLELRETMETLRELKTRRLAKDFDVIVVGIHPKETPEMAQTKYEATINDLNEPGTENGWKFLVGDAENIRRVTNALGFYYTYDEGRDAIDHPSGIMFISPNGRISSYIYGADYTPEAFERNIDLAAKDAVGQKAEEIFFGCIHVDPITGERSLVIRNVLKVLGVITLAVMGLSFAVLTGRARLNHRQR